MVVAVVLEVPVLAQSSLQTASLRTTRRSAVLVLTSTMAKARMAEEARSTLKAARSTSAVRRSSQALPPVAMAAMPRVIRRMAALVALLRAAVRISPGALSQLTTRRLKAV